MPQNPPTVLAINPGTRCLGIAVFQGNQLKDWRVKILKGKWSKEKMRKALGVIADLVDRWSPNSLSLKRLHPSRISPGLKSLILRIEKQAIKSNLEVHHYSINELEALLCPDEKGNKRKLAEAMAANYPEIYPKELNVEQKRKNPYHIRMFEAVALGAVCANQLDNQLTRRNGSSRSRSAAKQNDRTKRKNPGH